MGKERGGGRNERGGGGARDGRKHAVGKRRSRRGVDARRVPPGDGVATDPSRLAFRSAAVSLCSLWVCVWCSVCPWVGGGGAGGCSFVDAPSPLTGHCVVRGVGWWGGGVTAQFGDARFHQQTLDAIAEACAHLLDALILVGL